MLRIASRLNTKLGRLWGGKEISCGIICNQTPSRYASQQNNADETTLPDWADVVVVGGGVSGCSTLYHLAKNGITDAVLLERDSLTSGTTWHTAGLVWALRPSDLEVALIERTRDLMQRLEQETGINTGWINNGGLFIASTQERLDEYKRLMTLGRAFGIESHILSPEETKTLYPLMNTDDITASLYSPSDGTIEPTGYCNALTRSAKQAGAKVFEKCSVTGVQVGEDDFGTKRVKSVQTDKGTIRTRAIINAAGVWAPQLGRMAGVHVPLIAMRHAYVVTEGIPGVQNKPNVRDHDASVYLKLQGDTLCVGGYEPNPIFWDQVDNDFAFGLFDLDWDVFSHNIQGCVNRVPAIEEAGIKSTVCGPESFTADHKPLMGEAVEVRGFYLFCGMNSGGLMLSACGEQMAKWVANGHPEFDMFSYSVRRFPHSLTNNQQWLKQRSHEAYAKNYSIVFPFDEPLASRNMHIDELHQDLLEAGCVYQERHGWERPGWFAPGIQAKVLDYDFYGQYENDKHQNYPYNEKLTMDYTFNFPEHQSLIGDECRTCRDKVALFNMSYFGKFYLTGPQSQEAADWIFSNDMSKYTGHTLYTCMLNDAAGVEADLTVSVIESGTNQSHSPQFDGRGFYVAAGGAVSQHCFSHMLDIIQDKKWNCQITDASKQLTMLSLQGPHSRDVLQKLTETDLDNDAFPFSTNQVLNVAGESVRAIRLSFVGELGWELHIPDASAIKVYRALMQAGAEYGIVNAGYRAIDNLSIEKGYRHWHSDVRADDTPLESGLMFTCKLRQDTPFKGREALVQQKREGPKKRLACFTIDDDVPLLGLETIWRDGIACGFVRRAGYAFHLNKSMAYGYVTRPDGEVVQKDFLLGGAWQIESLGNIHSATLHTQSPFDPKHNRVKGMY